MSDWDPAQYARFREERSRPFHELVERTPADGMRRVADLGCGTGELTCTLLERWPAAEIVGIDTSPTMIARARALEGPRLRFVEADLREWAPDAPLDAIVSNAALQWVRGHGPLLERLVGMLAPGGVLAVQMPRHADEPAYGAFHDLCRSPRWPEANDVPRLYVAEPAWYADTLGDLGCEVDLWETIYHHHLPGPEAILEWMRGTSLRPVLDRLGERGAAFEAELLERLRACYPVGRHGIRFPFRRLFFVARRATATSAVR